MSYQCQFCARVYTEAESTAPETAKGLYCSAECQEEDERDISEAIHTRELIERSELEPPPTENNKD